MSPSELRQLNIRHFQKLLDQTTDTHERVRLDRFITEERAKPDSAYPDGDPRRSPLR